MNVITRGIRNAFRNVTRTVSIVIILGLSIGLALSMLVAHQAVGEKIKSVQASVGNTVSISPAGVRGFEGGGNPLTETDLSAVSKLAHVSSVSESLNDRLTSSNTSLQSAVDAGSLGKRFAANNGAGDNGPSLMINGQSADGTTFTPPVMVIGTNNPTALDQTQGGGTFTLKSGNVFDGNSTDNVAVIGTSLAAKNNLKVGSTFTAYGTTITVVGIYDAGNTFSDNQVIMPLATVQKLSGQTGDVTNATVQVDSVQNIDSVTSAAKKALGDKADVTNEAEQAKQAIEPLQNIQTISLYSLIGAVIAGSVIILLTMIMIVRERRREIGVIKAIGASNVNVMSQFAVEAVTLTALGAVIGTIFGVLAGSPITNMLVSNSANNSAEAGPQLMRGGQATFHAVRGGFGGLHNAAANIHAVVGWNLMLYGLGAAIVIALIGSGLASFFIAKVRPAEVMRVE
jgi:putative ABC transport system permease protein